MSPRVRKEFGFHLLKDTRVCETIVFKAITLAEDHLCKRLLEIGPGKGALTHLVFERGPSAGLSRFTIVEKNPDIQELWKKELLEKPPALATRFVEGDFLEIERKLWTQFEHSVDAFVVLSNLPYSVGTAILDLLTEEIAQIPAMVLMFQKEVGDRILAEAGTKKRGSLSLWQQNLWNISSLARVPRGAFAPPPKVDSEVLVFERRAEPRILQTKNHLKEWQELLNLAFGHKRKMLRSNLSKNSSWKQALDRSGVDPTLRAEALEWKEWESLFNAYFIGSSP